MVAGRGPAVWIGALLVLGGVAFAAGVAAHPTSHPTTVLVVALPAPERDLSSEAAAVTSAATQQRVDLVIVVATTATQLQDRAQPTTTNGTPHSPAVEGQPPEAYLTGQANPPGGAPAVSTVAPPPAGSGSPAAVHRAGVTALFGAHAVLVVNPGGVPAVIAALPPGMQVADAATIAGHTAPPQPPAHPGSWVVWAILAVAVAALVALLAATSPARRPTSAAPAGPPVRSPPPASPAPAAPHPPPPGPAANPVPTRGTADGRTLPRPRTARTVTADNGATRHPPTDAPIPPSAGAAVLSRHFPTGNAGRPHPQCPACGAYLVAVTAVSTDGLVIGYACGACDHRWTTHRDGPWPDLVVDPRTMRPGQHPWRATT